MPRRPLSPCKHPGCANVCEGKYCSDHQLLHSKDRPTAQARGYNSKWKLESKRFLQANPLCVECKKHGRITAATLVDHIKPHRGNKKLFWDRKNWQPLCTTCHNRKTATEDGGFGRGYEYKF